MLLFFLARDFEKRWATHGKSIGNVLKNDGQCFGKEWATKKHSLPIFCIGWSDLSEMLTLLLFGVNEERDEREAEKIV